MKIYIYIATMQKELYTYFCRNKTKLSTVTHPRKLKYNLKLRHHNKPDSQKISLTLLPIIFYLQSVKEYVDYLENYCTSKALTEENSFRLTCARSATAASRAGRGIRRRFSAAAFSSTIRPVSH